MEYKYPISTPKYLIFIHVIRLKDMLLEGMTPDVANTIFSKFGVKNASSLDKGELKNYYIALVKKHHPDAGGSDEEMRYINAAYDVLSKSPKATTSDAKYWNDLWRWRQEDEIPPNRTYPKGKAKGKLQKINSQFRFEDETVFASGKSDYFDLLKIVQYLNSLQITVMFDPVIPYDEKSEQWNTNSVLVYLSSDIRSKQYMVIVFEGGCQSYY